MRTEAPVDSGLDLGAHCGYGLLDYWLSLLPSLFTSTFLFVRTRLHPLYYCSTPQLYFLPCYLPVPWVLFALLCVFCIPYLSIWLGTCMLTSHPLFHHVSALILPGVVPHLQHPTNSTAFRTHCAGKIGKLFGVCWEKSYLSGRPQESHVRELVSTIRGPGSRWLASQQR